MSYADDQLSQRVAAWLEKVGVPQAKAGGVLALQGWALREELRRSGPASQSLMDTIDPRIGEVRGDLVPAVIEKAQLAWQNLLADLDKPEDNADALHKQIRDVFYEVFEALILAEDHGSPENEAAARSLFNSVVPDLYVFEPVADIAAQSKQWDGRIRLSDLLSAGVAGLYGGEVRQTVEPVETREEEVPEFAPVERFVRTGPSDERLTLEQLAQRLAASPWWYVKWASQRLKLSVLPKTRELRIEIFNVDNAGHIGKGRGLDGWDVRLTHGRQPTTATINHATATLKLPPGPIDPTAFALHLRDPAERDWVEVYGQKI